MPPYEYACRAFGAAAVPVLSVPAVLARASASGPSCDTGPGCCGGGMCGVG